uniref:Transposase n=1 Tax=Haemonchus contortus TaxID=6289 RepID=A0A7I4XYN2_HAECO
MTDDEHLSKLIEETKDKGGPEGIRSSELERTKINYVVAYAKKSKIRRAGHVVRYSDDRWTGRLLTGSLWTSNKPQDGSYRDGRPSSLKL